MINRARIEELRDEVGAEDLAEVVAMFCEEVEETLDRIAAHPYPAFADNLHFLKGSALNIGMSEVGELCQAFEKSLRTDPSDIPDIGLIAAAFHKARAALYLELAN